MKLKESKSTHIYDTPGDAFSTVKQYISGYLNSYGYSLIQMKENVLPDCLLPRELWSVVFERHKRPNKRRPSSSRI